MGDHAGENAGRRMASVALNEPPGGTARLRSLAEVAILTVDDLVVLARRTVHPHYVVEGMLTHCQCGTCVRVERALRRVAAGAGQGGDDAPAARSVPDRDAMDARDQALIREWREHAAIERADACAPRSMSPALRSVHNHCGRVYDACADQLAAIHPPRPPV